MYAGAFIHAFGIPLALGSRGVCSGGSDGGNDCLAVAGEEKFLAENLDGYLEYQKKGIKYRLVPFIW